MTGAIDMIEFTPDAQIRLANYLQQVRSALAGSSDINPDEIEADIREHVENELHDAPQPVNWTRSTRSSRDSVRRRSGARVEAISRSSNGRELLSVSAFAARRLRSATNSARFARPSGADRKTGGWRT